MLLIPIGHQTVWIPVPKAIATATKFLSGAFSKYWRCSRVQCKANIFPFVTELSTARVLVSAVKSAFQTIEREVRCKVEVGNDRVNWRERGSHRVSRFRESYWINFYTGGLARRGQRSRVPAGNRFDYPETGEPNRKRYSKSWTPRILTLSRLLSVGDNRGEPGNAGTTSCERVLWISVDVLP